MLTLEIVSSRTAGSGDEKKYVAYMLQVRQDVTAIDPDPVNVERRYTHFHDLYIGLKKDFPDMMSSIDFPRKMLTGNFDTALISSRAGAFESFLAVLRNEMYVRDSLAAVSFFQDMELNKAKQMIDNKDYESALYTLETSFKLLNKVYTDRSPVVLGALCRVVACADFNEGLLADRIEKWAQLALRRYESVSDYELLMLYVPLLHTCMFIWEKLGRDKTKLEEELSSLKKRGMKVDSVPTLMEAVDQLPIYNNN